MVGQDDRPSLIIWIPVIVAIITVVGGISVAVISNWDKIALSWHQRLDVPIPPIPRAPTDEIVMDLSGIDSSKAPGFIVPAAPELHKFGISVEAWTPEQSEIVVINNRAIYGGRAIVTGQGVNILTQIKTDNKLASFTLAFSKPCSIVSFVRPALFAATSSGVTHPAWSAHALDVRGNELGSESEGLIRSFSDVQARTFTIVATAFDGIAKVKFDSDPRLNGVPFAGFSAVLLERMTCVPFKK